MQIFLSFYKNYCFSSFCCFICRVSVLLLPLVFPCVQDDIIPRLSVASLTRLRNEILQTDW